MFKGRNRLVVVATTVLMLVLLVATAGCWGFFTGCIGCVGQFAEGLGAVVGSGDLETQEMAYTDFNKLEIGSAFDAEITRGDSYSVNITADDNVFQYLDVHQSGETLKIGLRSPWRYVRTTQIVIISSSISISLLRLISSLGILILSSWVSSI